jgi:hypothetical protein
MTDSAEISMAVSEQNIWGDGQVACPFWDIANRSGIHMKYWINLYICCFL